jgi:UDP-glucose 4-epimerase
MVKDKIKDNEPGKTSAVKRIVILGHSGFIGSRLEEHLHKKYPQIETIGKALPSIDFTRADETLALSDFFDMNTAVIMLAAIKPNIANDLDAFVKNIQMAVNLCKLLQKKPVARLIYFSSAAVYGEDIHNIGINEKTPPNPRSYYGMAKYACEKIFYKTFSEQQNSSLLILRPPVVYGPGEKEVVYDPAGFVKKAIRGEKITLWGDGSEKREFIFIDDIIIIVEHFVFDDYNGVLNVASGKSYSFNDIVKAVSALGCKVLTDSRERTREKVDNAFDNKLFAKLMPGFKFTSLKDGISKVLKHEEKLAK